MKISAKFSENCNSTFKNTAKNFLKENSIFSRSANDKASNKDRKVMQKVPKRMKKK